MENFFGFLEEDSRNILNDLFNGSSNVDYIKYDWLKENIPESEFDKRKIAISIDECKLKPKHFYQANIKTSLFHYSQYPSKRFDECWKDRWRTPISYSLFRLDKIKSIKKK